MIQKELQNAGSSEISALQKKAKSPGGASLERLSTEARVTGSADTQPLGETLVCKIFGHWGMGRMSSAEIRPIFFEKLWFTVDECLFLLLHVLFGVFESVMTSRSYEPCSAGSGYRSVWQLSAQQPKAKL